MIAKRRQKPLPIRHARNHKEGFYFRKTIIPEALLALIALETGAIAYFVWEPW